MNHHASTAGTCCNWCAQCGNYYWRIFFSFLWRSMYSIIINNNMQNPVLNSFVEWKNCQSNGCDGDFMVLGQCGGNFFLNIITITGLWAIFITQESSSWNCVLNWSQHYRSSIQRIMCSTWYTLSVLCIKMRFLKWK